MIALDPAAVEPADGRDGDAAEQPLAGNDFSRHAEVRGITLVRNADALLPLAAPATIAVIGQSAALPRTQGGALVQDSIAPLPLTSITDPETGQPGIAARFRNSAGKIVFEESRSSTSLVWLGNLPAGDAGDIASLELSTDYRPAEAGRILLGVSVVGPTTLSVDGDVLMQAYARVDGEDPGGSTLSPPTSMAEFPPTFAARGDGAVDVEVGITSTGDRPGREVAQVYLSRERTAVNRPFRWLAGFEGLTLAPGTSGTVLIRLPLRAFQHWQTAGWAVEPGQFRLSVGPNVADLLLHSDVTLPL